MTDVFFSYKKEDGARVEPIARALANAGYEVWWDHNIPPGRTYRDVIGAALQQAKCVVVVWSTLSANAQWVLDEADEGKKRNVLLPLMIDDVEIPYGFRQIEAARLVGWNGDTNHPEWKSALNAVAHMVGRAPGGPPKPFASVAHLSLKPSANARGAQKPGGSFMGPAVGVIAAAALIGGGVMAWQSGMFGGAAPETTDEVVGPGDMPTETAAADAFTPPPVVIVPNDPMGTFFASGYAYCDAKLLHAVWADKDIGESKLTAGQKLINGIQDGLEASLTASRQAGNTCGWEDTGYSYADAEKLAAAWGNTVDEAKLKAADLATNGRASLVKQALGG